MYKLFDAHKWFHIYHGICSPNKFIVFEIGRAQSTIPIVFLRILIMKGQLT